MPQSAALANKFNQGGKMRKFLILIILLSSSAQAGNEIGILKIYEQFTLASAAAGKCIKPEKKELTDFLANYQMVAIRASMEIQKRNPKLTKSQATEIINNGNKKATKAVYQVIEEEGCESPKIQDLIKRFHVQAKWNPYNG